jgi:hypothetical protein
MERMPATHRPGCHVGRVETGGVGYTSTGYFVLLLCAALVVAGLVVQDVISLPWL